MSELFNECIPIVLKSEGGYANDPDDSGGETYQGISRRNWPKWEGWNIIDEYKKTNVLRNNDYINDPLLDKMVIDFYYAEFWKPLNLEGIENKNSALQIFDFAINAGQSRAIKTAQRLSGSYVDGKIGPDTIAKINNMGVCFYSRYMYARKEYYQYLVKLKPRNAKFLNSWINRVEHSKI
jgi:lysozyme family protein